MTLRRIKEKNKELLSRPEQSHPYNLYLRPNLADTGQIASTHDFRSTSRGKSKLKLHIFKSRSPPQDDHHSPNPKDLLKSYSSLASMPNDRLKPKNKIREYLAQKNALLATKKSIAEKDKAPQPKKMKREYKLIHQMKKERHIQAQQRIKNAIKFVEPAQMKGLQIQAASHEKMDAFAQEMQLILSPPAEEKEADSFPEEWVFKPEEPIQRQKTSVRLPNEVKTSEQSIVNMNIPASLMQSQQYPQLPLKQSLLEQHKAPDLSRSFSLAEKLLKQRRNSSSSIDASFRQSKVRAEISISLALQSRQGSRIDLSAFYKEIQCKNTSKDKLNPRDKVNAHLEVLQSMVTFVYQSIKFDQIGEEWEQLNFLIYKKFYIQRRKVLNFIMKYPMRNPFCIYNAEISSKQIIQFMKTGEGAILLSDLKKENQMIKQKLASIYGQFDKAKVGEKINLYEYDNFSHWIIEQLWAELILTEHNASHTKEEINIRLSRILQLIFLISEINGKYECSFEDAETAIAEKQYQQYIKDGKDIFERYIFSQERHYSSDED